MLKPVDASRVRCFASREEWLAARQGSVGGSEIAAILGCSPYAGPWDVLARRVAPQDRDSVAMARGRDWEQWVLYLYQQRTGYHVCAPGAPWEHDGPVIVRCGQKNGPGGYDSARANTSEGASSARNADDVNWATCSPDAWAYDSAWGLVEAKTSSNPQDWGTPGHYSANQAAEHVPAHYLCQCLWGLLVTGLPWCDLVALIDRGFDLRIYRIHADAELQADLFAQVAEWRQAHLIEGKPLQIDGSEACRRVVERPPTDPGREATEQEAALIQALAVAKAHAEQWQATEEMAKNYLLQSMGPAERLYVVGGPRVTRANGLRLWMPQKESK